MSPTARADRSGTGMLHWPHAFEPVAMAKSAFVLLLTGLLLLAMETVISNRLSRKEKFL